MTVLLAFLTLYYAVTLVWYWAPLLAMLRRPSAQSSAQIPPPSDALDHPPFIVVVAPCRGGAASIAGMVAALKKQAYPQDRYRILIVVDTEDAADPSPAIARAAGALVYERRNPGIKTKGDALNEVLQKKLKHDAWDALVVLDIDVRAAPDFLAQVALYVQRGAQAIQAAVLSKNPDENSVTLISHSGQSLSQLIQRGRARLGLTAILSGGGMVFTRRTLIRLGWRTSTGWRLSDDGELNLRLALQGIPITYGESLGLRNALPSDIRSVRLQRQRWFAARTEARFYLGAFLRKALTGRWRALESLFYFAFLPGSSLSFVLGGAAALVLDVVGIGHARFRLWGCAATVLWALHGLYYVLALRAAKSELSGQELKRLPGFLAVRMIAILQGIVLGTRTNPGRFSIPSNHRE